MDLREHDLCYQLFVADIFVRFGNIIFLRHIGIPMGTKSAALIVDLFYTAISTYWLDYSTIIDAAINTHWLDYSTIIDAAINTHWLDYSTIITNTWTIS